MSDQPKKKRQQVSHQQFFTICNELQTHREVVLRECKSRLAVSVFLKQRLNIDTSQSAVANALNATGIVLENVSRKNRPGQAQKNARTLATELLRLYKKLGEEPSENLVAMVKRFNEGVAIEYVQPVPFSVPIKSVPDPLTIPVVGGRK